MTAAPADVSDTTLDHLRRLQEIRRAAGAEELSIPALAEILLRVLREARARGPFIGAAE